MGLSPIMARAGTGTVVPGCPYVRNDSPAFVFMIGLCVPTQVDSDWSQKLEIKDKQDKDNILESFFPQNKLDRQNTHHN